jgi:CheY-like chemotaxis protein
MTIANRHKILLVEDEGLIAASLVEDLHQLGYSADPVNSGEKALSAIGKDPPDLVLMDIKLKGRMDGIQTSERITNRYGIPIIYLTAHSDKSFLERAKFTEPYGYLIKPVGKSDLDCAIEMALHRNAAERKRKMAELKALEGLLHICSFCKRIKDTDGSWRSVEAYIEKHTRAQFTHGICPDCLSQYVPGRR